MPDTQQLTVAVTGPTGDIGRAFLRALDREPQVGRVIGMARRPFDPRAAGLSPKVEYRRGDVLDRDTLGDVFAGADVVVHLAFIILGKASATHEINMRGSRNVFEAAIEAGARRLVYTSSVAAYGFHPDNPQPLTEDLPPRGTESFDYSRQKGELEGVLREIVAGADVETYVFRPCIVAGEDALAMIREIPYTKLSSTLRGVLGAVPLLRPFIPDPGIPLQLVHHDDVADAMVAAVLGRGAPGIYNLGADGAVTLGRLAKELGWYSAPVPKPLVEAAAAAAARAGSVLPASAQWLQVARVPSVMSNVKARRELGWSPRYDTEDTLRRTVEAARANGML